MKSQKIISDAQNFTNKLGDHFTDFPTISKDPWKDLGRLGAIALTGAAGLIRRHPVVSIATIALLGIALVKMSTARPSVDAESLH